MKNRMILTVLVVWIVPAYSSVTILSQQHHIYGEAPYYTHDTYDITNSVPVSASVLGAMSAAGDFYVSASTGGSNGQAGAESTYIFTIDHPTLIISLVGDLWSQAFADIWGHVGYSLLDYTTGLTISDQSWSLSDDDEKSGAWSLHIDETPSFLLNINHEYELNLSASVTNADESSAILNITLIPEPTTLFLLTIGMMFAGRKRRN